MERLAEPVRHVGRLERLNLVEELRRRSGGEFDLPEGTVYPALYRLEGAGLLASDWQEL